MSGKRGIIRRSARACWSLFRIRVAETFQYRAAALASGSISVFWALIEISVLTVFYRHGNIQSGDPNGLSLGQAISYVWLGQAVVMMSMAGIDGDLLRMINSGDVGVELCRPLDLYFHWFSKSAAGRLGGLWWRALITLGVGLLVPAPIRLSAPASATLLLLSIASLGFTLLLTTSFCMLCTAVRLGISWGDGPIHIMFLVAGMLSGSYLPLQLWPDAMQEFLLIQPFAGYLDIPARLYVGALSPSQAGFALGLQLGWTLVFIALGRLIMSGKLKNLIVQGG